MKFTFQALEPLPEKRRFIRIYGRLCGDNYSEEVLETLEREYLPYAQLFAWKGPDGTLAAGYAVAPGAHSRFALRSSPETLAALGLPLCDCLELNLVWIAPEYRKGFLSFLLWTRIIRDLGFRREKGILFVVSGAKKGLMKLYRKASLRQVAAETPYHDGRVFHFHLSSPARVRLIPLLYGFELLSRLWRVPSVLFRNREPASGRTPEAD